MKTVLGQCKPSSGTLRHAYSVYWICMPHCARTGCVLAWCCHHRTDTSLVQAHYGMFTGEIWRLSCVCSKFHLYATFDLLFMMTSWHGNAQRASNVMLCCFLSLWEEALNKQWSCWWFEMPWCSFDIAVMHHWWATCDIVLYVNCICLWL